MKRLGAALARQSGQDENEAVRQPWGKLATLLQHGNAAIVANGLKKGNIGYPPSVCTQKNGYFVR